jgi:P-type Ca2+ transporter type 2C
MLEFRERFIRSFPGRIRMEVYGLKWNRNMKEYITQQLYGMNGILKVDSCTDTGRVLVAYDEKRVTLHQVCQMVQFVEEKFISTGTDEEPSKEVAATLETPEQALENAPESVPENFKQMPMMDQSSSSSDHLPLPLALSIGGLGFLAIKQLMIGRSALARSTTAFHLAAGVSLITGYPFLKRGFQRFTKDNKLNDDLILGTSSLMLALVRENLIALAGLSILQYLNWKRSQAAGQGLTDAPLSPEMESYSEKASKLGVLLGGATWAFTRNPIRGLAVLLAANPRPATMSTKYTWHQAEYVAKEKGCFVPKQGSLSQLSRTGEILFEDTSLLFEEVSSELQVVSAEEDEEKIWCAAASLMKKSNHPWKNEIIQQAEETDRTIRTAFCVEEDMQGIKGKINGLEVFIGSSKFLQENGVDCQGFLLHAKRLERAGYSVQLVGKKIAKEKKCLGILMKKQGAILKPAFQAFLQENAPEPIRISVLQNSLGLPNEFLKKYQIDVSWMSLDGRGIGDRIASFRGIGGEVLFAAEDGDKICPYDVPVISMEQTRTIISSLKYAKEMGQLVDQHFRLTKVWNVLGTALTIPFAVSAPVVNFAADALSLTFLARAKRRSEEFFLPSLHNPEIAAAAETAAVHWHTASSHDVMNYYQVQEQLGLCLPQVKLLRKQYGWNQLQPKEQTKWMISFLGQFKEFTTLILLGAAGLAFLTGGRFDGLAMGAILVANALIGTVQERKAEKVVEALNQFQPPVCRVIREGEKREISGTELVPGDLVCLEAGDRVPADLRILRAWSLEVNEAALTGESLPVGKKDCLSEEDCPLSERKNMLYMGTDVTRGKAVAIVVNTGMATEMGKLMALMKTEEKEVTPLQQKVTSISKTFVKGAMFAGGIVFITGLLRGIPLNELITTSITLAASAVPEGLPVTITIALSAGIYRMAKKNALIRKLSALETLGRTTVICSDKTGTLTKNEMTVRAVATTKHSWMVTGEGYEPIGTLTAMDSEEIAVTSAVPLESASQQYLENMELKKLLEISLLCNNSTLEQQDGQWSIKGDPTEGALLTLAAKAGLFQEQLKQWNRCHEVPFDSYAGRMSVVCQDSGEDADCHLLSKGSVETILQHSKWYQEEGEIYPLTDEKKKEILRQNEDFAREALRVLGFAYRAVNWDGNGKDLEDNELIYVGMAGMIDPPKADVEKSIQEAFKLGVKPVMITGDHPVTAIAIAKQLGIWDGQRKILTGWDLQHISDEELMRCVNDVAIFARVSPEHKLRIVTALQQCGHIVVMTGDGVNDSPAIKKANIGIAMGRTGTEVTKETADMVLKEDHFGSIVDGVKEGRTIIGNIRKALGCLLTGNLAEVLVTSAAVSMGMPIPLVPIQILLMNLLTDALPAMILAVNPGEKTKNTKRLDIIDKELYQKVMTRGLLLGAGSLGLFAVSLAAGAPVAVAQTTAFATLVAGQLMQTFSWRQEGSEQTVRDWTKDRFLVGALGLSWLALFAAIYVPQIAGIFHTAPLPISQWLPILAVAGSISLLSKPLLKMISGKRETWNGLQPNYFKPEIGLL